VRLCVIDVEFEWHRKRQNGGNAHYLAEPETHRFIATASQPQAYRRMQKFVMSKHCRRILQSLNPGYPGFFD
jgi:hypothetical protein